MTDPRSQRLIALLRVALDVVPERRDDWLAALVGSDRTLADELRVLLANSSDVAHGPAAIEQVADRVAHDGHSADLSGALLGDFRLAKKLGQGGAAVVYVAEDVRLGRRVALKLMRRAWAVRSGEASFRHEARALARLRHEHVAVVYDYGLHEWRDPLGELQSIPWLAVELVDGAQPITAVARTVALEDRLELLMQACRGLAAAHQALIEHGDVSSANVLVDRHRRVKVVDFGLARLGAADDVHAPQQLAGNLPYLAPELLGTAPDLTVASAARDVFSFGVVIAEVLTGRTASELRELGATRSATHRGALPALRPLAPELPRELDWIVAKATDVEPGRRYRHANELLDDLGCYLARRPLSVRRHRATYVALKFFQRKPWHVATLTCALLASSFARSWFVDHAEAKARDLQATEELTFFESVAEALIGAFDPSGDVTEPVKVDAGAKPALIGVRDGLMRLDRGSVDRRVKLLAHLGNTFRKRGDFAEAEPALLAALDLVTERYGERTIPWAERQHDLGLLAHARERFPEASTRLHAALDTFTTVAGAGAERTRHMRDDVAELSFVNPANWTEAGRLLAENVDLTPRSDRAAHARACQRVAQHYLVIGRPERATEWVERGTESELAADVSAVRRANAHDLRGRHACALRQHLRGLEELEACLEIRLAARPQMRIQAADTLLTMRSAYAALGRASEADAALERAYQLLSESVNREHPNMLIARSTRAEALGCAGRLEEALAELQAFLDVVDTNYGATSERAEKERRNAVPWLLVARDPRSARTRLMEALEIRARSGRGLDPTGGRMLVELSELLGGLGETRLALQIAWKAACTNVSSAPPFERARLDSLLEVGRRAAQHGRRGLALAACSALEREHWPTEACEEAARYNAAELRESVLCSSP
ncbi:MAG: serine/threonine-protein kinase [Planctomycetes bacterium]|nr:serine/threonine-protein kinase [Planctomycetota bacterium]